MPIFLRSVLRFSRQKLGKVFRDVLYKIEIFVIMFRNIIGLTFDQIAKSIGRDEVWVAAAFYGQVNIGRLKTTKLVHVL